MNEKETADKIASLEYRITQLEAHASMTKERIFGIEQREQQGNKYKSIQSEAQEAARRANQEMNTLDAIGQ